MQVSRYNFFVERRNGAVLYNAVTGSFIHVNNSVYQALRRQKVPEVGEEYLSTLLDCGAIHTGDQTARVLSAFELQKYAPEHIGVTIAPTIECNYACWYCYQNSRRLSGVMTEKIQDETVKFISQISKRASSLALNWFGGEPLLAKEVVINLTKRVNDALSETRTKQLDSFIITNGLLLDRNTALELKGVGITGAQISIDALFHLPPTQRGVKNSDGTLSVIIENIISCKDVLDISIRINVSSVSEGDKDEISQILKENDLLDLAHFARVEDNEHECNSTFSKTQEDMIERKTYARSTRDMNFEDLQIYLTEAQNALRPKKHFCGATDGSLFVVDHRGDVSRCFFSAGVAEERIGNVAEDWRFTQPESSNFFSDKEGEKPWEKYSPGNYSSCTSCKVLPLCMGGCSHARVLKGAELPPCEAIKYNINLYVDDIGSRLKIPND